jgi:hypothetical protein
VAGDVDAEFLHGCHCVMVEAGGLDACAGRIKEIPGQVTKESLGHLAAAGVAGAKEQDSGLHTTPVLPNLLGRRKIECLTICSQDRKERTGPQ